jgi:hemophore
MLANRRGPSQTVANSKEFSMTPRRGLAAVFVVVSACGAGVLASTTTDAGTPSAGAATDPCAASQVAETVGAVALSIGSYLDAHPQTDQALTTIVRQQPGPQSLGAVKNYFDANPQAGKDMAQLQQPLTTLSSRCRLPLTLPALLGLIQGGAAAGSLPDGSAGAHVIGPPAASAPALSPAASSAPRGAAALPGPPVAGLP